MIRLLVIFIIIQLSSCITPSIQKLNPTTYYRNDVCFTFYPKDEKVYKGLFKKFRRRKTKDDEEIKFCGTGVLPFQEVYDLEVQSYGKLNFFALTTCHEEDTTENPDKGIFKKNGKIKIQYQPTLEVGKACPLYISAYDRAQRHGFGILVFENPRYKLDAKLKCNGYITENHGVSICQSRKGLIQEIAFKEEVTTVKPVVGAADKKISCPVLKSSDNKVFEFALPSRECIYGFIGKKSKKIHQFYSAGYEEIIVRE